MHGPLGDETEHSPQPLNEVVETDFEVFFFFLGHFDFRFDGPAKAVGLFLLDVAQSSGEVTELAVFEQLLHQFEAGVFFFDSSSSSSVSTGSIILDLIWMSVAAMTMNSPAMSRSSSRIISRNARYCSVTLTMGMSKTSISWVRIR